MDHRSVSPRWRALSLLVIGLVAGTLLLGTAGAHIGTPNHLWQTHIKAKVKKLTYTKAQANQRFILGPRGVKMFAAVQATGATETINASAGPVASVTDLGTGEYRVNFNRNFRAADGDVFAQCTAVNAQGHTCAWSYNGPSLNQIDISIRSASGTALDAVFSLMVWVPA